MTININIEYNPFFKKFNTFCNEPISNELFNNLVDNLEFRHYVDSLFDILSKKVSDKNIKLEFKGFKFDFEKLKNIINDINNKNKFIISLEHIEVENLEQRLINVHALLNEIQNDSIFKNSIPNMDEVKTDEDDNMTSEFNICVLATMSAGKSTFINGMLGTELLPNANEATTATIAEITNNDSRPIGEFEGYRENHSGKILNEKQLVTLETLTDWNKQEDTSVIKLDGKIIGIVERDNLRVMLTDTPGPNNRQDKEYKRIILEHIKGVSEPKSLILYLLNATQLGTDDDKRVLNTISELIIKEGEEARKRFIFIVNKCDQLDPEEGEKVETVLENVKEYLESNGINNPQLFPISAHLAYLFRKKNDTGLYLTRSERAALNGYEELFLEEDSMDLVQYMPLTSKVIEKLNTLQLPEVLKRSGIPAIECILNDLIDSKLNRKLDEYESTIKLINSIVNKLSEYLNDSIKDKGLIEKIKNDFDESLWVKNNLNRIQNQLTEVQCYGCIGELSNVQKNILNMQWFWNTKDFNFVINNEIKYFLSKVNEIIKL